MGYRQYLRSAVAASAAPYGYTLTVWTSGAVTTHAQGLPDTVDALLLLLGAVIGFGAVGSGAFGGVNGLLTPVPAGQVRVWAGVHLPSVGLSVLVCSLLVHLLDGRFVWPLVGFTATTIYLLMLAVQFWVAARRGVSSDPS